MNGFKELVRSGFKYHWELFAQDGRLIDDWTDTNLMPIEGLNYMLSVAFRNGTQLPIWYISIYEGNYTPVGGLTAATYPSAATECTAYVAATRPAFTTAAPSAGAIDNSASRAEFVSVSDKTLYGGAILSSPTKGSTAGAIASAVRFASPKPFATGSTLRVTAGIVLTSI